MTNERSIEAQRIVANGFMNRYSVERDRAYGAAASNFFDGSRDIYSVAGYPEALNIESYIGRYQRDPLAYRIVTAPSDDTWRKPFAMLDGATLEDGIADTEFVKAWNKLVQFDNFESDLLDDSRRSLWHYFYDVDRQAGIGQYAVMILGFDDGKKLSEPLDKGKGKKLVYVNVLNEFYAKVYPSSLENDSTNPRFGLPTMYEVNYGDNIGTIQVHFSRVIHVAEGGVLYGKPRLEAVYNRLIDVEKLMSASGEAGWRAITRKIIISSKDGYQLSEGTVTTDKVESMIHGLRDVVELEGADVNIVSGEIIDPTGPITQQLNMISAGTDIPVRILIGSERGQLASDQDEKHWNDNIQSRRTNFVESSIVRQFIRRMIYAGIMPLPTSGNFYLSWPSLYENSDEEQARTFLTYTQGISQLAGQGVERIAKANKVVQYFVRGLPADAVIDDAELAKMDSDAAAKVLADAQAAQATQLSQDTLIGGMQDTTASGKMMTEDMLKPPVVNSYSRVEQAAILEAAAMVAMAEQVLMEA